MFGRMNNNKAAGSAFERLVMKRLESAGYFATRSAGSHHIADIVAVRCDGVLHKILFVQCKLNGELDADEWNELFKTARRNKGYPILAQRGQRGKGPAFWELGTQKVKTGRRYVGGREWFLP